MNEKEYAKLKRSVRRVRSRQPERRSYWDAFLRGLYRGFIGGKTGGDELAGMLQWAAGGLDRKEVAQGYREGLEFVFAHDNIKEGEK